MLVTLTSWFGIYFKDVKGTYMKERIKLTNEDLKKLKQNYLKEKNAIKQQEIGCDDKNTPSDLWLDESFAKGLVDDIEASCCLAGCHQEEVQIRDPGPYKLHPSDILHPVVSRLYEIVRTWPNVSGAMPLLWYLEQALIRSTPHVKWDLLLSKCKESEYRQKMCVDKYPELVKKLGLTAVSGDTVEVKDDEILNDEAEDAFLTNPKDRNDRLLRRALELAEEYNNADDIKLDEIHNKIVKEEELKSKVSKETLKHVVKLKEIKRKLKMKKISK